MNRERAAPTGTGTLRPTAQQAIGNAAKANVEAAIAVASSAATAFVDALVQPRSGKAKTPSNRKTVVTTGRKSSRTRNLARKPTTKKPRKAAGPQRKPVAKAQRTPTAKARGRKAR